MTRTALVTGASGGIVGAIARNLGQDHDVAIHYNSNREKAMAVAEDVRANGQTALIQQCDVRDPDAVETMMNSISTKFGNVDVLVNNAGVFHGAALEAASNVTIQETLRVNLEGTIYCVRSVLPEMLEHNKGWIVNISSTAGTSGSPTDIAYSVPKGGILALTKSLAKQYTGNGIFANAVAPGPVKTAMFADERHPAVCEASPIGRLITPEEGAKVVRTFATTSSVSGQTLVVDGGLRL